jgi:hypothetical protein
MMSQVRAVMRAAMPDGMGHSPVDESNIVKSETILLDFWNKIIKGMKSNMKHQVHEGNTKNI